MRKALEAEAAGNPDQRAELLARAIEADPAYAPAHWQLGQLQADGKWLPIDDAAEQAAASGKLDEYRKLRDQARDTFQDHLKLAKWCASQGLNAAEQAHLSLAHRLQPNSRELNAKLGLVPLQGEWVPAANVEEIKQQQKEFDAAARKWRPKLEKLLVAINSDNYTRRADGARSLAAINDLAAIPAMEILSADGGASFGEAVVESLAKMPQQAATDALLRQAICSPYGTVRKAAAVALKPRSMYSYVPTLMGFLQAPIEIRYEQFMFGPIQSHRLLMLQEGPLSKRVFASSGANATLVVTHWVRQNRSEISGIDGFNSYDPTAVEDVALSNLAHARNLAVEQWNGPAIDALAIVTGNDLGKNPVAWWKWWFEQNELYQPSEKPSEIVTRTGVPPVRVITRPSCFVAGTKVWTPAGPQAIETVKAGECVLAQHPETGELAYKPVLGTTVRPPSPVLAVKIDGDKIFATLGHPFWVSGKGWRMTKELTVGDWLHAPNGPLEITDIAESARDVCYNLVVADFGTYFVGERKVLVHDNNIREVTTATVPGLVTQ